MADRQRLYASAFLRAVATGMAGVLLGIHLAGLGMPPAQIGLVVGAGLAGAALASLLVMAWADALGRRRLLLALAVLSAGGGLALAFVSSPVAACLAALLGMVNGMGRDRGAALVLEQAALPSTTSDAGRTRAFAVYNVVQDVGHALGSLLAGLPALLRAGPPAPGALRPAFVFYAALLLPLVPLALGLSPAVEAPSRRAGALSAQSRRALFKIGALFGLDSLGGGLLTTALLALFFHERFGAGEGVLGVLFCCARALNALSHLGAAWLAPRLGLLNTMVFTHLPSSLLLVTVAVAPSLPVAAALFLLREGLVEMDVPTRQSYLMAIVRPDERTVASGVTHLVRMGAWAVAPVFAGAVIGQMSLSSPLLIGAAMKVAYDLLLYRAFRGVLPPEERGRTARSDSVVSSPHSGGGAEERVP